jgi:hypothetical protein
MESLNGHEAGNGGHGQGNTYGNSPFLDPTGIVQLITVSTVTPNLLAKSFIKILLPSSIF